MRVFGLVALVVAAVGFATPSQAYLQASSGVEVVGQPRSGGGWDITLETDTEIGAGVFNVIGATSFTPVDPPCTGVALQCQGIPASTGVLVGLAVNAPSLPPNVGSPTLLGFVDNLTGFDYTNALSYLGSEGFQDFATNADILPTTFVVIPEPGTMVLLGAGLAGLAFLRRRAA